MSMKRVTVIMNLGVMFTLTNSFVYDSTRIVSSGETENDIQDDTQEYCNGEVFSAKCLKNEIMSMKYANYGRMRIGRCLQTESDELRAAFSKNPLFVGCSVDVLNLFDEKCSGKNQCDFQIPDAEMRKEQPCFTGLTLYLEANYECLSVIEEDRSCIISVSGNPLHMMTQSTNKLSCGTAIQPWTLEAAAGQHIDISLVEFSSKNKDALFTNSCVSRGQIIDKSAKRNVSICRVGQQRNTVVYTSFSNFIQIILNVENSKDRREEYDTFLIGFVAVGCLNLIPPEDAWLRRKDNEATVGCYTTRQTWILRCTGNQWVGVIGNCSTDVETNIVSKNIPVKDDIQVIAIVSIVIIGLAVCLIILCCGVIFFRRYSIKIQKYRQSTEYTENCKRFNPTVETQRENVRCTFIPAGAGS